MAAVHLRHWQSGLSHCRHFVLSFSRATTPANQSSSRHLVDVRFFNSSSPSATHLSQKAQISHSFSPRLLTNLLGLRQSSTITGTNTSSSATLWSRWYRSKNDALAARARPAGAQRSRRSPSSSFNNGQNPLSGWFNRLPGNAIVWGILGLNGAVYFAWQYAADKARAGDPSLFVSLYKNVTLSWRNIREGRIWTIITSTFSHSSTSHFLLNALTFYFMAPPVVHMLGNTAFLSLYFLGGVSCSALSLFLNQSIRKRDGASNGASGAIYAVISFFACAAPHTKFLVFFVVPIPAWAVVTGFFIWDGLSAITDRRTTIDGAGHVGGILAGAAYWFFKARFRYY